MTVHLLTTTNDATPAGVVRAYLGDVRCVTVARNSQKVNATTDVAKVTCVRCLRRIAADVARGAR